MQFNKIYNEDCLQTLSRIEDQSIDLVVTSPPYNMNLRIRNGGYCSRQIVDEEFSTKYEGFDDNVPIDEFYANHSKILRELLRTSKIIFYNIQIVTGSKRAFFKMIGDFADNLKDIIIWDKRHGQPAMLPAVLNRRSELLLVFEHPSNAISRQFEKSYFERGTLDDVWVIGREKGIESHGATFPEKLVEKILLNFTKEDDLVYDPFSGSGTTAVVCRNLKRRYIGSEISAKYCEIASKRLDGYFEVDLFNGVFG